MRTLAVDTGLRAAYDRYLQGRHQYHQYTKESAEQAIQRMRDGLTIVGENALLYAALA